MDFSNAADMYVGSSPVKEAWMNGKLVWHRPDIHAQHQGR